MLFRKPVSIPDRVGERLFRDHALGRWITMHIRTRKLVGTVALFALVTVWALLAMALAQSPTLAANRWLATLYYAIAGLGWVLPAMPLIWWMVKPDREQTTEDR